jgi:hypothetical protein
MIQKRDILWLGAVAGLSGGLIGGILLGSGIALVLSGKGMGLFLVFLAVPLSAGAGYLIARGLARHV